MRIVMFSYAGNIGIRCFEWLMEQGEEVIAVVTRPGEPGERVKEAVFEHYVPVYQPPRNVNDPRFIAVLRKLEPDLFFSTYFGRLFSPELLAVPRLGCINMHNSLLPKYRGQAPSTWGIINGDTEGGQTIHYLDEGIDTGDIIAQKSIPILPNDTGSTLGSKLVDLGVELFKQTYPLIKAGNAPRIPQNDEEATYCVATRPRHARIDWTKTATEIYNLVRAVSRPTRGAHTSLGGERLSVYRCRVVEEALSFGGQLPGQVLAVTGKGVLVKAGEGQLLLTDVRWAKGGRSEAGVGSFSHLALGAVPCVLGDRR